MANTLIWPVISDGYAASVSRAIKEHAQATYRSNPDAWGAQRALTAANALAAYAAGLDLEDPRWILLLRQSPNSDEFRLGARGGEFVQKLGLDRPSDRDPSQHFTEFAVAVTSDRPVDKGESAQILKIRTQYQAARPRRTHASPSSRRKLTSTAAGTPSWPRRRPTSEASASAGARTEAPKQTPSLAAMRSSRGCSPRPSTGLPPLNGRSTAAPRRRR